MDLELSVPGIKFAGQKGVLSLHSQILLSYLETAELCFKETYEKFKRGDLPKGRGTRTYDECTMAEIHLPTGYFPIPQKDIEHDLGYSPSKQTKCLRELALGGYVVTRAAGLPAKRWAKITKALCELQDELFSKIDKLNKVSNKKGGKNK